MMKAKLQHQSGQTLIEVVLAAGLMVLVLTTLAAGIAIGVRNNRVAKDQAAAKEYVREELEWFRNMRDVAGWETFDAITKTSGSYCLATLPATPTALNNTSTGGCGATLGTTTKFTRTLTLTKSGTPTTSIQAVATVSWTDGTKDFKSESTLSLYKWK